MCLGCLPNEKEKQELLNKVEKDAKQHAISQQKFMVIYNLPDGKVSFMEEEAARAAGITPIKYISHM